MLKGIEHSKNSFVKSLLGPKKKTKSKRKKRQKKQKKPKEWNFENRIKKVTDNELIHLDWDAPVIDSPDRNARQSWTIYNDPEETPHRYSRRQQRGGMVTVPSQFGRKKDEEGDARADEDQDFENEKVAVNGLSKPVTEVTSDAKDKNSCKFVDLNHDIIVYNENTTVKNGKSKTEKAEIKREKISNTVKFKNAPELDSEWNEHSPKGSKPVNQTAPKKIQEPAKYHPKAPTTVTISKKVQPSHMEKHKKEVYKQKTPTSYIKKKPTTGFKAPTTREEYTVPVRDVNVLVSNSSQKFKGNWLWPNTNFE